MAFLRLSLYTAMDRNEAIARVREAIVGCGGWIVDHALFPNLSATINMELPGHSVDRSIVRLEDADLDPRIDGDLPEDIGGDLRGQVTLTFIHQNPDLKRDVPPFK